MELNNLQKQFERETGLNPFYRHGYQDDYVEWLEKHLETTEKLLDTRQQLLDEIPECPMHGKCVPHALEWIKEKKNL